MKFLISILVFLTLSLPSIASPWVAEKQVPSVGTIIVKKNSLNNNIQFKVVECDNDNTNTQSTNTIFINKSDLNNTKDDNEIAYIISNELSKIIVKHLSPKQKYTTYDIDAMSIDLMINSGYNPLASISILTKNSPDSKKHAMDLYNYVSYNYPTKVRIGYYNDEYDSFLKTFEQEINDRNLYKSKLNRFNRVQSKLCKKRMKRLEKYNEQDCLLSKWNISADLLLSITEPEHK